MELPTIRQLECIVAVADKLNFRLAAEACFITQPALSSQIQRAEQLFGFRLFERDRRKVLPTAAGAVIAEKSRAILADLHELSASTETFHEPLTGTIKLGVIPTVAPYVLPPALKAVHERYPKLRVLIREDQTDRLLKSLEKGDLDLLLLALDVDLGGVETLPIMLDPFVLAVPPDHRLAKRKRVSEKDLIDEQVLLLEEGHCLRDQALALCQTVGAKELDDFRASSLTTLVQMVCGGVGVTLLPETSLHVEARAERGLTLIPFGGTKPSRTLGLAWRPTSIRKPEFELLAAAIGESLGAQRGSG
ncbi:MAG: hydrogen peroxide-inducible genes activator [Planctomycetota bacterium]